MLENLVSLLNSLCATWLNLSSTPWAMDMILAFVGGLGFFLLLLPFLPDNPSLPSPPPLRKKKSSRKYHMVEKNWHRMRKRSCLLRARRDFWEEAEGTNDLDSLLRSHLGNLLHGSRLNQFQREDAPGETLQPLSATADRARRQPLEDIYVTTSSSLVSQAPSTEHLPPPPSTLSPGLKTFPGSLGSQSPLRASSPQEPSIPLGRLSPQPFSLSSSPLHSPGPMTSPPPQPDPGLALPQQDLSLFPLGTIPQSSSPPNNCYLPSPVPAISTLGHSGCPVSALPECQEPPHTFPPALPSSQPPSVSHSQTQEHVLSLPVDPCYSLQARAQEVSGLNDQKGKQHPISRTVQQLRRRFLVEPEEKRGFPSVVKKPQKVFSQPADKHGAIQEHKSSGKLPVDVTYFKIREQLEEHLQKRLMCGLSQKVPLSLDREEDPGTRQAKENCGPSQSSMISEKSSQVIQKAKSELPEISQVREHSDNDLETAPKDLFKGLEISTVKVIESICDPASARKGLRLLRSDSGNDPASSADKKNLRDSESICPSRKVEQTGGGVPGGNGYSTLTLDHACDHPGNSNIPVEAGEPSLQGQQYGRNTQDLSVLDARTQWILEAHLIRFSVRHRWGLAFTVIRVILKLKKTHTSLLPQPAFFSSASQNSKADSICQDVNFQEEPSQRIAGERVKETTSVLKMQGPVTGHSLKSSMKTLSGDDPGSSETPPNGQETSLTAQPHVYCTESRAQRPDPVSRPGRGSVGPNPTSVMDRYQPEEGGGGVVFRDPSHQVLKREVNVGPPCSRPRDIQKTVGTEVKKPLEWAVTKGAMVTSPSPNLNVSPRTLKSLGSNKSLPSPGICTWQDPGVSSLGSQAVSKTKSQDSSARVLLQEFATGKVLQVSASEMPLTKDIPASQAHPTKTRGGSTSCPSPSQGICDLSVMDKVGQELREPKMPKSRQPRVSNSQMFAPPEKRGSFERPKPGGKEERSAGRRGVTGLTPPSQVREVRDSTGHKTLLQAEKRMSPSEATIGNFLQNILPKHSRGKAESPQKAKPPAIVILSLGTGKKVRVFRDTGSVEAQVLMSSVRRILSASKENFEKGGPQVDRWSSLHKTAASPQQKTMLNNLPSGPQVRPQFLSHVTNRSLSRDRASNPASPAREPGPLSGHFHRRPMGAGASEPPAHCPRHCALQRTVFPNQSCDAAYIRPGEKSLLGKPVLCHTSRSCMG